eukprot:5205-Heterococcus_DN1.PRE.1
MTNAHNTYNRCCTRCEQSYYSSYRVRAAARRVKQEKLQEVMRMAQLERWAATKLQCNWRAAAGRQKFKARKLKYMARWKEMFDKDKQYTSIDGIQDTAVQTSHTSKYVYIQPPTVVHADQMLECKHLVAASDQCRSTTTN